MDSIHIFRYHSLTVGTVDGTVVDSIDDIMRILPVHGATHGLGCTKHLLHGSRELFRHGPGPHNPSRVDDVVHGDVPRVPDVLHLLPVPRWLFESLDDQGSSGRHDGAGSLPVLNFQLHSHLEAFPVLGGFSDVWTAWTSIVLMEGFAEVENNKVTVLCNGAEEATSIDAVEA